MSGHIFTIFLMTTFPLMMVGLWVLLGKAMEGSQSSATPVRGDHERRLFARTFHRDESATVAIEFAFVAPMFIGMIVAGIVFWQVEQTSNATQFAAISSATAAARAYVNGDQTAARAAAANAFAANQSLFILGAAATQTVSFNNQLVTVVVSTQATPILNVRWLSALTLTASASD